MPRTKKLMIVDRSPLPPPTISCGKSTISRRKRPASSEPPRIPKAPIQPKFDKVQTNFEVVFYKKILLGRKLFFMILKTIIWNFF